MCAREEWDEVVDYTEFEIGGRLVIDHEIRVPRVWATNPRSLSAPSFLGTRIKAKFEASTIRGVRLSKDSGEANQASYTLGAIARPGQAAQRGP